MGLGTPALIAPEPREARRSENLPGASLLRAADFERAYEIGLRFRGVRLRRHQPDFAGLAMDVRLIPTLPRAVCLFLFPELTP